MTDIKYIVPLRDKTATIYNVVHTLTPWMKVRNTGSITVNGLNYIHITPYTDTEFQLRIYQTYITIKS